MRSSASALTAVPDVHHVAILHNIFLSFEPQRAFGAGRGCRTGIEQRIPADCLGANKMMLEVGVNRARRLRSLRARRHRPRAALVLAGGEKADQAQELVALADQP